MPDSDGILTYEHGICALDSGFVRPWLAAIHLIVEGGRAAIVDAGTNASVPRVLAALALHGIEPAHVDYVMLTHVHLDHAAGAGLLLSKLPHAILCVHPRGARHMIDPRRLIEGASAVYGEAHVRAMYGDLAAVPQERVRVMEHGSCARLAGRELRFFDTPGHARHHLCIHDQRSGHVFAGDSFGLGYREFQVDGRCSVFPTTSPVQFDPPALHCSIDLIAGLQPAAVYLTHFGQVRGVERLAGDLHRLIDAHVALARAARDAGAARHQRLKAGVEALVLEEAGRQGWRLTRDAVLEIMETDIELNAQGLGVWLDAQAA